MMIMAVMIITKMINKRCNSYFENEKDNLSPTVLVPLHRGRRQRNRERAKDRQRQREEVGVGVGAGEAEKEGVREGN